MTSARKPPASVATAVRQTPFTETEPPSLSSAPSGVATSIRAPSPSGSTALTVPVDSTSPVNISPLREAGGDQPVPPDLLPPLGPRPPPRADPPAPPALHRAAPPR